MENLQIIITLPAQVAVDDDHTRWWVQVEYFRYIVDGRKNTTSAGCSVNTILGTTTGVQDAATKCR